MRVLLQRVREARVKVDGQMIGEIGPGLLLFLGITPLDRNEEAQHLAEKCAHLRIFDSLEGKKNDRSVKDLEGEILVVSQFTLYGDCSKGRRPGFDKAATPEAAKVLCLRFIEHLKQQGLSVQTGQFQALMQVELINDGPVTFFLEKPPPSS